MEVGPRTQSIFIVKVSFARIHFDFVAFFGASVRPVFSGYRRVGASVRIHTDR